MDASLRTILGFLGTNTDPAIAAKFLPENVLAADKNLALAEMRVDSKAAVIEALEVRNADLKKKLAAGAVPRSVIVSDAGALSLYIAGIGYVLTSLSRTGEVKIRLTEVGLIASAYDHAVNHITGCVYEENKLTIKTNVQSGSVFEFSFAPCPETQHKYLREVYVNHTKCLGESDRRSYNDRLEMTKSIRVRDGITTKTVYLAGIATRVSKVENGIKTVTMDGVTITKTHLCDRVLCIVGATTRYILAVDNREITYVLNSDEDNRMTIAGSIFTFYHTGVAESFRLAEGKMTFLASCPV